MAPDPGWMTAADLTAAYGTRDLSPVEATRTVLDRIAAYDPIVNAYVLVDPNAALAAAAESERRWVSGTQRGPADGVPVAIKDVILTRGWPTLRGSHLVDDRGPWLEDAPAVARLREAGAVLLGKTTTPEFAWKAVTDSVRFGTTGNPWDPGRTPGGSSGGSATAVGLGMCTWSVGTDSGGSVRIPASFTGTVALKPTSGLVPVYPASNNGTLSHHGPITRSVLDAAMMLDVLVGFDARDWLSMPTPVTSFVGGIDDGVAGLRVGFSPTLGYVRNDPEVEAAVRAAADVLAAAGARIDEVDPQLGNPVDAFDRLWFASVAATLAMHDDEALDRVDPRLRECAERGRKLSALDYLDATQVRADLGQRMGRFHQTYDVLVTPTLPIAAFPVGSDVPDGWPGEVWTSWTPYTYPFNMTQQPALSVPCGFTSAGLPIGLQVVGPRHGDRTVLRVGHTYQRHASRADVKPAVVAGLPVR